MRLGEAVPDIPIPSAVDFILPVNCRRSTTAVRAASGTAGKMNSSEAEPRHAACLRELHVRGGCGHSRLTRRASKLAVGVLSWREPRPLQRSRVQWRARGYQGHQVVALVHSDQDCALVGLCLSMCEVGVRAGGVCG